MNQEETEYELKRLISIIEMEFDEMMQISRGYIQNTAENLLYQLDLERTRIDTWELRDIFSGCFQREYNRINDEIQMQVYQAINQIRNGKTIDKERFKEELLNSVNQQFNQAIRRATEEFSYELNSELGRYRYYIDPNNYTMQDGIDIFAKQITTKAEETALENKQELTYTLGRLINNIEFKVKNPILSKIEKEVEIIKTRIFTVKGKAISKELLSAQDEIIQYYDDLKKLDSQGIDNPNAMVHFENLRQKFEEINNKAGLEYKNLLRELGTELAGSYMNMPFGLELVKQFNQIVEGEFPLDKLQSEIKEYGTLHNMIEQKYISLVERKKQEEQETQNLEQKIEKSKHAKITPQEEIIESSTMDAEQTEVKNNIENPTMDMETYKMVESIIYSNPELTEEQRAMMLETLQTDFGSKAEQQEEPKRR